MGLADGQAIGGVVGGNEDVPFAAKSLDGGVDVALGVLLGALDRARIFARDCESRHRQGEDCCGELH